MNSTLSRLSQRCYKVTKYPREIIDGCDKLTKLITIRVLIYHLSLIKNFKITIYLFCKSLQIPNTIFIWLWKYIEIVICERNNKSLHCFVMSQVSCNLAKGLQLIIYSDPPLLRYLKFMNCIMITLRSSKSVAVMPWEIQMSCWFILVWKIYSEASQI